MQEFLSAMRITRMAAAILILLAAFPGAVFPATADGGRLIDNFDRGSQPNADGGRFFVYHDRSRGSSISAEYTSDPSLRFGDAGYSLKLSYDVGWPKGWCSWGMDLPGVSARGFSTLRMKIRASDLRGESFTVFLKDVRGNLMTFWTGVLNTSSTDRWRVIDIPIQRKHANDFSDLDSLMILFDSMDGKGYLLIDDIGLAPANGAEPEIDPVTGPDPTRPTLTPASAVESEPYEEPVTMLAADYGPVSVAMVETVPVAPAPAYSAPPGVPVATPEHAVVSPQYSAPAGVPVVESNRPADATPVKPAEPAIAAAPVDDALIATISPMDKPEAWGIEGDQGTTLTLSTVAGLKGKAMALKFSYGPGTWVQIRGEKPAIDMTRIESIRIRIRPVKGVVNIELKLTDDDWSTFGKKLEEVEADGEWMDMTIPLEEFTYWWGGDNKLDLKNFRGIYIAATKISDASGEIQIDDIEAKLRPQTAAEAENSGDRVLIDSFERSVPENAYSPVFGDRSVLNLESVRESHDGDYSMRFDYTLETTRSLPTYVGAVSAFAKSLDWTGVTDFSIWVKGDGSSNIFRINIIDRDEEVWSYSNRDVLKSGKWQKVTAPIDGFAIPADVLPRNKKFDVDEIQRIEILVVGTRTEKTTGTFRVDEMSVGGINLDPARVGPAELRRGLVVGVPAAGATFNFGLVNYAEFMSTPEESEKVNHYGKFLIDAQLSKFSTRIEIASDAQDYGSSTYIDTLGKFSIENPRTVLVNSQVNVKDLHPSLRLLTLGYLWVDFGRWAFTPQFGSKGLKAEGAIGPLGYEAFAIKKRYESYATGGRFTLPHQSWLFQSVVVYDNEYAQVTSATVSGTLLTTQASTRIRTQPVSRDFVATFEAVRKLNKDRITVSSMIGRNINTQYGVKSGTFSPTIATLYNSPLQTSGNLGIVELKTSDYPWKRVAMNLQVRWIGTHFKPSYREGGVSFDDIWSDQKGVNIRMVQSLWKWNFAGEFDGIARLSNTLYERIRKRLTIGFYGIRNIDIALTGEMFKEVYRYSSTRTPFATDKNERKFTGELHLGFNLSDKLRMWAKGIEERIVHPASGNAQYKTDIFQTRLEYYVSNNARVFAEHKTTQYGNAAWEPIGSPFDDNFTRLSVELNF